MKTVTRTFALTLSLALAAGCGAKTDKEYEAEATLAVKQQIATQLDALLTAAKALQAAAPAPDADGWNATADKAAVEQMKAEWKKARSAYEHIEGAIAILFPDLDETTDQRYDKFIETDADDDLFDDQTVTGIHAIERILWSDAIPQRVVDFESKLQHYKKAAFPQDETEAREFKTLLCQKLVDDVTLMQKEFTPLGLDAPSAFRGVIGSLTEQHEKVLKASTGEEESRYAQYTLADMRANLDGGVQTYAAFQEWVLAKEKGAAMDKAITDGFARVKAAYDANAGDAIPPVPQGFDAKAPTADQLATPYGKLFGLLGVESDATHAGSLVAAMNSAADALGIPQLQR